MLSLGLENLNWLFLYILKFVSILQIKTARWMTAHNKLSVVVFIYKCCM